MSRIYFMQLTAARLPVQQKLSSLCLGINDHKNVDFYSTIYFQGMLVESFSFIYHLCEFKSHKNGTWTNIEYMSDPMLVDVTERCFPKRQSAGTERRVTCAKTAHGFISHLNEFSHKTTKTTQA